MIRSINPASGEELARFTPQSPAEVEAILAAADTAQRGWRLQPIEARTALLRRIAAVLRERKASLAHLITLEMGKPIADAEAEIEKCALNCDYYAESAPAMLADTPAASGMAHSALLYEPLGVVLAIMPWNYPFWQLFRFAAPALAAGNGALLKHAGNVPQCALAIEEVMQAAGIPDGLFRTLLVEPDAIEAIIQDKRIAAVTLTGSTQVGMIVAGQAGKALKKQVLELGGSDPFIVLADADVEQAAAAAVKARYTNVGQSCVNAKRFIVASTIADAFVEAFTRNVAALKIGDPLEPGVAIGPMARDDLVRSLHDQVERSVAAGATATIGGQRLERPGFFYAPTILDHVTPSMAAFREETFGPVAAIIRAGDEEEAITLANDTEFGLGASIWSRDVDRALTIARRIDAGAVFVNAVVASDPRLPFGGIKHSGYGRELGELGLREFVNIKTLCVGQ
jgi:succinate-semialdehyde dehydrogenase / glutarate-semialdehyde dehydrogenase